MIVTITNQKGGIGKSTTALNLGYGLRNKGYKVLLIDLDAQANLTSTTTANEEHKNSYDLMTGKATVKQCIQPLDDNIDIITAVLDLATLDLELNKLGKEQILKEALEPIKANYDFIIIDTPPSLGIATVNALTTADRVLIPGQADKYSLEAVRSLYDKTINVIRHYTNPGLIIDGILLTRYKARTNITKQITEIFSQEAEAMGTKLYNAKIREASAIGESQATRQDIFSYDGKSNVASDFKAFTDEFLEGIK